VSVKIVKDKYLFDFSSGTLEEKEQLFKDHSQYLIFSELTLLPAEKILNKYSHVIGAFSLLFSQDKKAEIYLKQKNPEIEEVLKSTDVIWHYLTSLPLGFIVPRTKAMIINEAYYALSECVASLEDIDRAMVYGVNYPQGPFAWVKGKEAYYGRLLLLLQSELGDDRYCPHPELLKLC
jgi:3-hydroxybutyryl-CoA dehydrogenase